MNDMCGFYSVFLNNLNDWVDFLFRKIFKSNNKLNVGMILCSIVNFSDWY